MSLLYSANLNKLVTIILISCTTLMVNMKILFKKSPLWGRILCIKRENCINQVTNSDLSHIEISKQMHMFITCIWVQNKKNSVKQLWSRAEKLLIWGYKCNLITSLPLLDSVHHNNITALISISVMIQMQKDFT